MSIIYYTEHEVRIYIASENNQGIFDSVFAIFQQNISVIKIGYHNMCKMSDFCFGLNNKVHDLHTYQLTNLFYNFIPS